MWCSARRSQSSHVQTGHHYFRHSIGCVDFVQGQLDEKIHELTESLKLPISSVLGSCFCCAPFLE